MTKKSGVYGWPGDQCLHAVWLYDARGALTRHAFLTTVDKSGVRTRLDLATEQSAAVVKVPVKLASAMPVNVRVDQYDAGGIRLSLNGSGAVTVTIANGEYAVRVGAKPQVTFNGKPVAAVLKAGSLGANVDLNGPGELQVGSAPQP